MMNQSQNSRKEVTTIIELSNGVQFDAVVTGIGEVTTAKHGGYNFPIWMHTDVDVTFVYSKPTPTKEEANKVRQSVVDGLNERPELFKLVANPGLESLVAKHKNIINTHKPIAVVKKEEVIPTVDVKEQIRKAYQQGYRAGVKKGVRTIVEPIRSVIPKNML